MATELQAFTRAQIGKEVTPGTSVAATRILTYESLDIGGDYMKFSEPMEERNSLSKIHRSTVIGADPVSLVLSGELLFEDIVLWLQGCVRGGIAPTQPDAAVDLYTITPLYQATNTQTTYTIETGGNEMPEEANYVIVESIEIGFGADEACTVKVNMLGQKLTAAAFTGSLAFPTVETALGAKVQMYIDTAWSGIGGTQLFNGELIEGNIKINSGLVFVKRADGTIYATKPIENPRTLVEVDVTVELDDVSEAYRALWEANTKRFCELRFVGSNITGLFDRFIKVQWGGPFRSFKKGYDGGVRTVNLQSHSEYDVTGSAEAKFLVQNAVNAITEF